MTERNCPACWLISRMCRLRTRWPTSRSRGLRRWMPQGQRRGAAELISMPKAMKDSAPRGPRSASDDVRCRSPIRKFASVCLLSHLMHDKFPSVPALTHSSDLMKAPVIGCGECTRPPTELAPDGWLGPVSVNVYSGTVTCLREREDRDAARSCRQKRSTKLTAQTRHRTRAMQTLRAHAQL